MNFNPLIGVAFHWLGGLGAGSFYVFYHRVRGWPWAVYWLTGGFFSWIVMPSAMAALLSNDLAGVLAASSWRVLFLSWLFGCLWGFGSLTAGLAIRYLGMSLGQGVTLGFCAAFGTLLPPFFKGQLPAIAATTAGRVVLLGVAICLIGIAVSAFAGLLKEREMPEEQKKQSVKEFSFTKGMLVSVVAGIMSGFMSFALDAGSPIAAASISAGTSPVWSGLPKMVVILFGGFTANVIGCGMLVIRNRWAGHWFGVRSPEIPVSRNYVFCACAGITWYLQYFFYTMGESKMGQYQFSSWTLHLASIIIFSTMWGWILREWKGSGLRTHLLIAAGVAILIVSTLAVGYGNYLAVQQ